MGRAPASPLAQPTPRLGRPFWALWAASTCSGLGDGLNAVALPLLAASLTHRPLLVAGVVAFGRLPWLLVGLPAGAVADRHDRPQLMRRVDVVRAVVLAAVTVLVIADQMTIGLIYCVALVLGICDPFFIAASQAVLPDLVPAPALVRANGVLYVGASAGQQTVGPAVGGVLFALSRAAPFAADAASFVGSSLFLLGVRARPPVPRDQVTRARLRDDIRVGLSWYRRSRALRVITFTVAGLAFCQAMVSAILVLFALERLHLGGLGYGLFIGVTALGNVVGGLIADQVLQRTGTPSLLVGAMVLAGGAYLLASTMTSPVGAAVLLSIEAVAVVLGNVATVSFRQRVAPPELQARVATIWRTAIWGAIPIGALVGGVISARSGVRAPFVVAGSLQLLLAVVVARPLHRLLAPGRA